MTARVRIRPGVTLGDEDLSGYEGVVLLAEDGDFHVRLEDVGIPIWFRTDELVIL